MDEDSPRVLCKRCRAVMVPVAKPGGVCHGCSHLCGLWMPMAREFCARGSGHTGGCRTRYTMRAEAERKSQRGARAFVEALG